MGHAHTQSKICVLFLCNLKITNKKGNEGAFVFKKSIIGLVCLFRVMVFLNGCSSSNPAIEKTIDKQTYDYVKTLDNGLTMNLSKKVFDNNLMGLEFSFDSDIANISVDETALQTNDYNCYLFNKTSGERLYSDGDIPLSNNILYFDNVELSNFTLHFECPLIFELDSAYSVDIDINDSQAKDIDRITLPLGNYIEVNKITTRMVYDKYSDKCVDISFSTSGNVEFDIQVEKSEISTGAPVGDLKKLSDTNYIYTHPITGTEQDITISFTSLKINDDLNCDIEF